MARSLPRPCHTCGRIRCADHGKRARDTRASPSARGYDSRWSRIRLLVLGAEPWCRRCWDAGRSTEAVDVHHRLAVRDGGQHYQGDLVEVATALGAVCRWDGNLEPLCHRCHSSATARGE